MQSTSVQVAALLCAMFAGTFAGAADSGAADARVAAQLREELRLHGTVRAIAVLRDDARPGDPLERRKARIARAEDAFAAELPDTGVRVVGRYRYSPSVILRVDDPRVFDRLGQSARVVRIHADVEAFGGLVESALMVRAPEVHQLGVRGEGRVVAILDSGVDTDHPDLAGKVIFQHRYLDAGSTSGPSAEDDHGHGTHVAGIIASRGVLAPPGMAPGALIVAIKILNSSNSGWISDFALGIERVVSLHEADNGIRVDAINMSLVSGAVFTSNCDDWFPAFRIACETARNVGIAVIACAGNTGGTNEMTSPGCYSSTISVTSILDTLPHRFSGFASRNQFLDLVAPGQPILSSWMGGGTREIAGCSMATPHVAGTVLLLREVAPDISPEEIREVLTATGIPVDDPGSGYTFPRLDVFAAVSAVITGGDCNNNGILDHIDIFVNQTSIDCNGNLVPDECEMDSPEDADCNENGMLDVCDVAPELVLGEPVLRDTGASPVAVGTGDFDGDGEMDVATLNLLTDDIAVHLGTGSGDVGAPTGVSVGDAPTSLVAADFNDDRRQDLAAANTGGILTPGNTVTVLLSRGRGEFDRTDYEVGSRPSSIIAADLDSNGTGDLVVGHDNSFALHVLLNDGKGAFTAAPEIPLGSPALAVAAARLDGDEHVDVVALAANGTSLLVILNGGDGTFATPVPLEVSPAADTLAIGDLDRDGLKDLIIGSITDDVITFLWNDGNAGFGDEADRAWAVGGPAQLLAADADDDGDDDLLVAAAAKRGLLVVVNGGNRFPLPLDPIELGSTLGGLATAKLSGTRAADVIVGLRTTGEIAVFPNESYRPGDDDCNHNLVPDTCELQGGAASDCDENGVLDTCDVADGFDCNGNLIPDACDIASGALTDLNENGIPDSCERPVFHRGDANEDGEVDLSDAVTTFAALYGGSAIIRCDEAADSNNDTFVDLTDGIFTLSYLFRGEDAPPDPGVSPNPCGPDPDPIGSPGDIGCEAYDGCLP